MNDNRISRVTKFFGLTVLCFAIVFGFLFWKYNVQPFKQNNDVTKQSVVSVDTREQLNSVGLEDSTFKTQDEEIAFYSYIIAQNVVNFEWTDDDVDDIAMWSERYEWVMTRILKHVETTPYHVAEMIIGTNEVIMEKKEENEYISGFGNEHPSVIEFIVQNCYELQRGKIKEDAFDLMCGIFVKLYTTPYIKNYSLTDGGFDDLKKLGVSKEQYQTIYDRAFKFHYHERNGE